MDIEELAEYVGESKRSIYRYIKSGDCPPYIKLNARNIKFDKRDVDAWLESKKVRPSVDGPEGGRP
jgi:excisionase family DNA binding protein